MTLSGFARLSNEQWRQIAVLLDRENAIMRPTEGNAVLAVLFDLDCDVYVPTAYGTIVGWKDKERTTPGRIKYSGYTAKEFLEQAVEHLVCRKGCAEKLINLWYDVQDEKAAHKKRLKSLRVGASKVCRS